MPRFLILSPGHPGLRGGVTDHTSRMAARWRAAGHEVTIVADPAAPLPDADALLLQYVPFLYARRGVSRAPARVLAAARRRGMRTVLFVHEPWVPPTRLPWLLLSPLQRRQLRRLIPQADVTVTAVPAWARMLGPGVRVHYVGSTLGAPAAIAPGPLPAPVVFSPFAAGLSWDWIVAAVRRIGASPPLIVLGADADQLAAHAGVPAEAAWDARGRLDGPATLAQLAGAPLVLAPFADGLTGRRTSIAAALSVGARVVTSAGRLGDDALLPGVAGVGRSAAGFAELARTLWQAPDAPEARAARRQWYDEHLEPGGLDDRMAALLAGTA